MEVIVFRIKFKDSLPFHTICDSTCKKDPIFTQGKHLSTEVIENFVHFKFPSQLHNRQVKVAGRVWAQNDRLHLGYILVKVAY